MKEHIDRIKLNKTYKQDIDSLRAAKLAQAEENEKIQVGFSILFVIKLATSRKKKQKLAFLNLSKQSFGQYKWENLLDEARSVRFLLCYHVNLEFVPVNWLFITREISGIRPILL